MQKTDTIVFDLGNVIINLKDEKKWWEEDFFPYFDAGTIEQLMKRGFFQEYEKGNIDDGDFRMELHMARKYDSDLSVVDNAWNAILLDIPASRVKQLAQLAEQYDLYLLSNTNNIHLSYIRGMSVREFGFDIFDQYFTTCYFSHELGTRKPEEAIYQKVWQYGGLDPEHSLFLDDKAENLSYPATLGVTCHQVDTAMGFEVILPALLNKQ